MQKYSKELAKKIYAEIYKILKGSQTFSQTEQSVSNYILSFISDSYFGQGHSFHATGGRGGKKAQTRHCIRVLRSVTSLGEESVNQDLCDQGIINQLLGDWTGHMTHAQYQHLLLMNSVESKLSCFLRVSHADRRGSWWRWCRRSGDKVGYSGDPFNAVWDRHAQKGKAHIANLIKALRTG